MFVSELAPLNPVEIGVISNFSIDKRKTDSNFGYEYNGYIKVPGDGAYTFYNKTNDGSILYLDGKEFINTDGGHPAYEVFKTIALKKGIYKIREINICRVVAKNNADDDYLGNLQLASNK